MGRLNQRIRAIARERGFYVPEKNVSELFESVRCIHLRNGWSIVPVGGGWKAVWYTGSIKEIFTSVEAAFDAIKKVSK